MPPITAMRHPTDRRQTALAELRSLGRTLDRQVTDRTGAGDRDVDATLLLMKQAHLEVALALAEGAPARADHAVQSPTGSRRGLAS